MANCKILDPPALHQSLAYGLFCMLVTALGQCRFEKELMQARGVHVKIFITLLFLFEFCWHGYATPRLILSTSDGPLIFNFGGGRSGSSSKIVKWFFKIVNKRLHQLRDIYYMYFEIIVGFVFFESYTNYPRIK